MANKHFNLFGINLPENVTGHHYAVVILSGLFTIAGHAVGSYVNNKKTTKRRKKKVASASPNGDTQQEPKTDD